jgi:uncharacterized protein
LGQRDESAFGQGIYNVQMTANTYGAMLQHATDITASGRWAILDATFPTPQYRSSAAELARALRLPFAILHCSAPRAELLRRLTARRAAGSDVSNEGLILAWNGTRNIADLLAPLVP